MSPINHHQSSSMGYSVPTSLCCSRDMAFPAMRTLSIIINQTINYWFMTWQGHYLVCFPSFEHTENTCLSLDWIDTLIITPSLSSIKTIQSSKQSTQQQQTSTPKHIKPTIKTNPINHQHQHQSKSTQAHQANHQNKSNHFSKSKAAQCTTNHPSFITSI